jgi:Zn-finger nucleic acid-binding protein
MNCPVCDAKMRSVEKHGVEADICPDCKGIWLDRGELEKIIQVASGGEPAQRDVGRVDDPPRRKDSEDDHRHDRHDDEDHGHGKDNDSKTDRPKRKGSWLADIAGSFGGGD